jgi:hypothetical protein
MFKIILTGLSIIVLVATVFIVIYILYNLFSEDREKGKELKTKEQRTKELERLKEKLPPYEFESTQKNAVNKRFSFMGYLHAGDYVQVVKTFKDYYGFTHQAGEKFYFACAYFLPYEDGYTLFASKDKINIFSIFLQNRPETQGNICRNLKDYFEIIEQKKFKRE